MTFGRDSCNCCERLIAAIAAGGGGGGGGTPGPQIEGLATTPMCDANGQIQGYVAIQVDEATGAPTSRFFDTNFNPGTQPANLQPCSTIAQMSGAAVIEYCQPNATRPAAFAVITARPGATPTAVPDLVTTWLDPGLNPIAGNTMPAGAAPCFDQGYEGPHLRRICDTQTKKLIGFFSVIQNERDNTFFVRFYDTQGAVQTAAPANWEACEPLIPDEEVCYVTIGNGTEDVTAALSGPVQELGVFGAGNQLEGQTADGWIRVQTDTPATTVGDNMSITIPAGQVGATVRFQFMVDVFEPQLTITSGIGTGVNQLRIHSFSTQPVSASGGLIYQAGVIHSTNVSAGGQISWPAQRMREVSFKVSLLPAVPLGTPLTVVFDQMDFKQWRVNAPNFRVGRMYRDANSLDKYLFDNITNTIIPISNYRIVPCPPPADQGVGRTVTPNNILINSPREWRMGDIGAKARAISMIIAPNSGSVTLITQAEEREITAGTLTNLGLGRNLILNWGVDGDTYDRMLTGILSVRTAGDANVMINWTEERT